MPSIQENLELSETWQYFPQHTQLVLDWLDYFVEFQKKHGEPVIYGGKLLFPDGWTYSATDHSGPEWPPSKDKDELQKYLKAYWITRKSVIQHLAFELNSLIEGIEEVQRCRDIALPVWTIKKSETDERQVFRKSFVDLQDLQSKVTWYNNEIKTCNAELEKIESTQGVKV